MKVKFSQSTDNLKQAFNKINLPPIDVRESVMTKIFNKEANKYYMFNKKRVLVGIVLMSFLLCTVGFAAAKVWELKGPGNNPYRFMIADNIDSSVSSELIKDEWKNLQPGMVLAVLEVNDPSQRISIHSKPLTLQSLDALKEKVGDKFKSPAVLPDGYSFVGAEITFSFDKSIRDQMLEESKNTDKPFVIKTFETTDKIVSYSILYKNRDKSISVSFYLDWTGNDIYDFTAKDAEKIKVNNFEAIYTNQSGRNEIKWLETGSDTNTLFCIGSPSSHASKKDLLKMAESLK